MLALAVLRRISIWLCSSGLSCSDTRPRSSVVLIAYLHLLDDMIDSNSVALQTGVTTHFITDYDCNDAIVRPQCGAAVAKRNLPLIPNVFSLFCIYDR